MATVGQLRAELGDISTHLGDGAAMLRSFAGRVDQMGVRIDAVMRDTLRPDLQGPAVQCVFGAKERVEEAATLLDSVQNLLDTYASGL